MAQNNSDTSDIRETQDCDTIAYNSTHLIVYFYTIQDYDSAEIVLNNWQSICGISEPILRTRILFAILKNSFSEALYDSTIVDYILNYMIRMDTANVELYDKYKEYFGFVPIRGDYDYFTQSIADTLLQRTFYDPMALLFCEQYANVIQDAVKEIQIDTIYENTEFRSFYFKRVDKYRYKADFNLNFLTGIWIPYSNASLLGNHPLLGCQLGMHKQNMTYNLTLAFKFLKSKNEYSIQRDGNIETTDTFFGGYIGADVERELFKFGKNEFDLLAGIGYDGFQSVNVNTEDDDPNNDVGHSIHSINTNFGLGCRHFLKTRSYIGLQAKYNFVNYVNTGGTNLTGDNLTISLVLGGFFNERKYYELNELRYIE
jgi:hypothetical protein